MGSFRRPCKDEPFLQAGEQIFKPNLESGQSNDVGAVCEAEKMSTPLNTPTQQQTRSLITTLKEITNNNYTTHTESQLNWQQSQRPNGIFCINEIYIESLCNLLQL